MTSARTNQLLGFPILSESPSVSSDLDSAHPNTTDDFIDD
jgi:hypothetical protein